jgi:hypothetical protein
MTMWPARATIGRSALRCVCKLKESIHARSSTFFDWSRGFADGIVRKPSESVFSKIRQAVVLSPVRKPEETLYVYRQESDYGGEWRVSLGPDQPFAPPPPTWREHLRALGHLSKRMT